MIEVINDYEYLEMWISKINKIKPLDFRKEPTKVILSHCRII